MVNQRASRAVGDVAELTEATDAASSQRWRRNVRTVTANGGGTPRGVRMVRGEC
jgi:plasmid stabilization system protein ParE